MQTIVATGFDLVLLTRASIKLPANRAQQQQKLRSSSTKALSAQHSRPQRKNWGGLVTCSGNASLTGDSPASGRIRPRISSRLSRSAAQEYTSQCMQVRNNTFVNRASSITTDKYGTHFTHTPAARAQERAAAAAQLAEPPDVVPRWHRSNDLIGAGPAGDVYQVICGCELTDAERRRQTALMLGPLGMRHLRRWCLCSERLVGSGSSGSGSAAGSLRYPLSDASLPCLLTQALNDRTGELLAVKMVREAGDAATAAEQVARDEGLRLCLATRHPNLVRYVQRFRVAWTHEDESRAREAAASAELRGIGSTVHGPAPPRDLARPRLRPVTWPLCRVPPEAAGPDSGRHGPARSTLCCHSGAPGRRRRVC